MSIESVSHKQFKDHVDERHKSGNPFSADEISGMNTDQYHTVLNHVAGMQRSAPETAMDAARNPAGAGIRGEVLMHVGDLTHRMNEPYATGVPGDVHAYKTEYVRPKVNYQLDNLTQGYGFDREARELEQETRDYQSSRGGPVHSPSEVNDLLLSYADAHQALPVYNEPGYHARSAAVSVGQGRTSRAVMHLRALKGLVDDDDRYQQAMSREGSVAWLKSQEDENNG